MRRSRRWAAALTLAAALSMTACGDDSVEVAPLTVDVALAPAHIGKDLALFENRDKETIAAFANGGDKSLASDGHIWEIRRNDRLVGTLQITTVLPKIDLTELEDREKIVGAIIPGRPLRRRVDGIELYTYEVDDKATFVWFAQDLYEVLQVKDRTLDDYEPLVADIIAHQQTKSSFKPLTS